MSKNEYRHNFNKIVQDLSDFEQYKFLYHSSGYSIPLPSPDCLSELIEHTKKILFPGFFGNQELRTETINYYIGAKLEIIYRILGEQIKRGLYFDNPQKSKGENYYEKKSLEITNRFISSLPKIKYLLSTDVIAAYNGDPAAKNYGEAIYCYPSILALTYYRIAHELYLSNVPLLPRIISEMAHSKTGIDIHPGAEIGEYFFIDHGTGVVIGETSIIGKNVRLYQGVTLGAKSFPLDKNGKPIKGVARHPIVEDNVIIYSNSTILGRITIGKAAVIGGNMWVVNDIEPYTILSQNKKKI